MFSKNIRCLVIGAAFVTGFSHAEEPSPSPASASTAPAVANKPMTAAEFEQLFMDFGLSNQEAAQAFGEATALTPAQIRNIRLYTDQIKRATNVPLSKPGKPVLSTATISLEPGATPHTLRLELGTATSIVFQDATGAEWPIKKVISGSDEWTTDAEDGTNILVISPKSEHARSNLTVLLQNAPAPVILAISAGEHKEVDYRFDAVIDAIGPKAATISIDAGRGMAIPGEMIAFRDGVPPADAVRLKNSHPNDVQTWRFKDRLYVRSRMHLSTPAASKASSSADGTRVYEIEMTPILFMLSAGKQVRVAVSL